RALEILETEGDTEYTEYYNQLDNLIEEFSLKTVEEWKQNHLSIHQQSLFL
ncbi:unnamed protein product, partial [marine sediment metagenome]